MMFLDRRLWNYLFLNLRELDGRCYCLLDLCLERTEDLHQSPTVVDCWKESFEDYSVQHQELAGGRGCYFQLPHFADELKLTLLYLRQRDERFP